MHTESLGDIEGLAYEHLSLAVQINVEDLA